jgi:hypothetical protein
MLLNSREASAVGVYMTQVKGDRADLKMKIAMVQDNAEEMLRLLKENVTEEQAERYQFLANIVRALEIKGYGPRIRFKVKEVSNQPDRVAVREWKHLVN